MKHFSIFHSLNQSNLIKLFRGVILFTLLVSAVIGNGFSNHNGNAQQPSVPDAENSAVFGLELFPLSVGGGLNQVIGTPTQFIRGAEILWADVETTKGVYDWTKMANAVQEIKNAKLVPGAEPIVVVYKTPAWARKDPGYTCSAIKPGEYASFGNFMAALIIHLQSQEGITIKYWEIWNEPDIALAVGDPQGFWWGGCWGIPGDTYFGGEAFGEMLKVIYPKIKAAQSNADVLVGGLLLDCDPNNIPVHKPDCDSSLFLEGILHAGGGPYFDGISFHATDYYLDELGMFANPNWPGSSWDQNGPSLIQKAAYLRYVLSKYGLLDKYLMNTEVTMVQICGGNNLCTYNDPYPPILETTKSYYVVQAYAGAIANKLKANVWFDVLGTWLRNNGLVKLDLSGVLPAYNAYVFAGNKLQNTSYMRKITEYTGVTGYEFDAGSNVHIWLLWSQDGKKHQVVLPAINQNVYGVQGNKIIAKQNKQIIEIDLEPNYIEMPATTNRLFVSALDRLKGVKNGGFENGQDGWSFTSLPLPVSLVQNHPYDPRDPSKNTRDLFIPIQTTSLVLGNADTGLGDTIGTCKQIVPSGSANVSQSSIVVPETFNGAHVHLNFSYIIYSQDKFSFDRFEVVVNDGERDVIVYTDGNLAFDNNQKCKWYRIPGPENARAGQTTGWTTARVNLDALKGKPITILFRTVMTDTLNPGYYNTYTYLDNVHLVIGD